MPDRAQSSDDIEDRDPGLARERTDLAWTRTAISYAALGAVMLHTSAIGLVVATGVGVWGLDNCPPARRTRPPRVASAIDAPFSSSPRRPP
jgi:hypothetical protein